MLRRLKIFLAKSPNATLTEKDLNKLFDAYNYLFSQRIDGLFNDCHDLIWKVLTNRDEIDDLFIFFDRSSLVWRVSGNQDKEKTYLLNIKNIIDEEPQRFNKIRVEHIQNRLALLSQK